MRDRSFQIRSHSILRWGLVALLFGLNSVQLWGHALGENYIFLKIQEERLEGRFEFSFEDLEETFGWSLDLDNPDQARETVATNSQVLQKYITEHFKIHGDGKELGIDFRVTTLLGDPLPSLEPLGEESVTEPLEEGEKGVAENLDNLDLGGEDEIGRWVQFYFTCPWDSIPDILQIDQRMMLERGRFHRALLVVSGNEKTGEEYTEHHIVRVFGRNDSEQSIDLRESLPAILTPDDFLWQGVLHIWIGIDHILFLSVLLLPAVLRREKDKWLPVERFSQGLWNVIKIVTVFTLAHSITLALAALDLVRVPSAFVESVIAASIVIVALNNIWPKVRMGSVWVILGFGLFHGLGFASVMGELPFRMMNLKKVILLFNVGVELGQLAIVAIVFTGLFLLRRSGWYRPLVLVGGSGAAALVAAFWFVERAFGL